MADAPADNSAGLISTEQAARLLMISGERVRQLAKAGYIPKAAKGRVSLVGAVQGYIRFLKEEERRTSKAQSQSRVHDARALELEIKVAERRRDLIPVDDARDDLAEFLAITTAEIRGLPARVTRERALRVRLEDEINASLARMADRAAETRRKLESGGGDLATGAEDAAG
jgi:hypothetical protein